MVALLFTACAGFMAPQHPASRNVILSCTASPSMGFFDDLKKGFENDQRLEKDRDVNAGKNKKAPGYVKKKVQARERYESESTKAQKADQSQGDRKIEDLFSGWKW